MAEIKVEISLLKEMDICLDFQVKTCVIKDIFDALLKILCTISNSLTTIDYCQ